MVCRIARHSIGLALLLAGSLTTAAWAQSATVSATVTDLSIAMAAPGDQVGHAGWYGEDFDGRPTASGELFDMYRLTAASPSLPINSVVEVTNLKNGRVVQVRINDRRSPDAGGVIMLSKAAALDLGFLQDAEAQVRVRVVAQQAQQSIVVQAKARKPAEDADQDVSQQALLTWASPFEVASN
jgi:rare lipoprotein A